MYESSIDPNQTVVACNHNRWSVLIPQNVAYVVWIIDYHPRPFSFGVISLFMKCGWKLKVLPLIGSEQFLLPTDYVVLKRLKNYVLKWHMS